MKKSFLKIFLFTLLFTPVMSIGNLSAEEVTESNPVELTTKDETIINLTKQYNMSTNEAEETYNDMVIAKVQADKQRCATCYRYTYHSRTLINSSTTSKVQASGYTSGYTVNKPVYTITFSGTNGSISRQSGSIPQYFSANSSKRSYLKKYTTKKTYDTKMKVYSPTGSYMGYKTVRNTMTTDVYYKRTY